MPASNRAVAFWWKSRRPGSLGGMVLLQLPLAHRILGAEALSFRRRGAGTEGSWLEEHSSNVAAGGAWLSV